MSHPNDLERARQLLIARRNGLNERHRRVQRDLTRENDPLVSDAPDRAVQLENDQALEAIDAAAVTEIAAIDAALERLAGGQYGICSTCGDRIEPSRLAAVPHAVTCTACSRG